MLDIALLSSNASQLKYLLQVQFSLLKKWSPFKGHWDIETKEDFGKYVWDTC